MAVCTFFGHRACPESVKPILRAVLEDLITNHGVTMFYVGNQGQFDAYVRSILRQLKKEFPEMDYGVVLAYMPGRNGENTGCSDTMLPEGIESIHPKYAISWRNIWMLERADYVVTHILHSWGSAASFAQMAEKRGKTVINIDGISYERFSSAILQILLTNDFEEIVSLSTEEILEICKVLAQRAPASLREYIAGKWAALLERYVDKP